MPRSLQGTPCPLPLTWFIPANLGLQDAAEPAASFPPRLSLNPQSLATRLQSPQLHVLPLITPSNSVFLGLFLSLSCNPFKSTDCLVPVDHQSQYSGSGRSCGEHAPREAFTFISAVSPLFCWTFTKAPASKRIATVVKKFC